MRIMMARMCQYVAVSMREMAQSLTSLQEDMRSAKQNKIE